MNKFVPISEDVLTELIGALRQGRQLQGYDIPSIKSDILLQHGKDIEELSDEVIIETLKQHLFIEQKEESKEQELEGNPGKSNSHSIREEEEDISPDFNKLALEAANSNDFYFEELTSNYDHNSVGPLSSTSQQTRTNRFYSDANSTSLPRPDSISNEFMTPPPPGLPHTLSHLSQSSSDRPLGSELQQYSNMLSSPYSISSPPPQLSQQPPPLSNNNTNHLHHSNNNNNNNNSLNYNSNNNNNNNNNLNNVTGTSNPFLQQTSGSPSFQPATGLGMMGGPQGGHNHHHGGNPNNNLINSEQDFLCMFWEVSFKLFYNICSSSCITQDCLFIVSELLSLVERWAPVFQSPAIVIATDVVIQRAMYELSDKFVKKMDLQGFEIQNHFDSQQNIEDCISLLSTIAVPLCARLQNNHLQWNLSYLDPSNSTYTKMHTLNRQLQELLAWTSLAGQAAIPDSFVEMLRFISVNNNQDSGNGGGLGSVGVGGPSNNNMKMTTPRSMATLEVFDSILMNNINEGSANNSSLMPDFVASVENRMIQLLKKGAGGFNNVGGAGGGGNLHNQGMYPQQGPSSSSAGYDESNVKRCGCNVIGMSFYEGIDLDYVALSLLPPSPRKSPNMENSDEMILKELESIVEVELLYEGALKHIRACVKDCSVATNEFITNVMKPPSMINDSNSSTSMQVMDPSYLPRPSIHVLQALCNAIVVDAEEIHKAGEQFINSYTAIKSDRILNRFPVLTVLLNKIESYHEENDREEKGRISNLRRIVKNYEKIFRENGFNNVRSITNRCRFIQLKFLVYDGRYYRQNIGFTINLDSSLPIHGSELLRNIIKYDSTGKIKIYLNTIKKFVKSHKISDGSNGFLSLFGWMVMALHVLIKFKYFYYLPVYSSPLSSNDDNIQLSQQEIEMKNHCMNQLNRTSIMELLDRFFRYYVEEFDTFRHVVSLKRVDDVMTKAVWKKNPVLWRLSVEDPCDPVGSKNPYDLGGTMSRPGQLTTYKALRRAVYGMRSILIMGVEAAKMNIKKLFSKTELIHLARKSEYMGATIPQPKPWLPNKSPTTLLSPRDIQKPLSPEVTQKIETLDLTNFATKPLVNAPSYPDMSSENNYGYLSSRSEVTGGGAGMGGGGYQPDISPRYRSDSSQNPSAHGFSRVISENSLSGMINSPRDVLSLSNHSLTSSMMMSGAAGELRSPIYNDPSSTGPGGLIIQPPLNGGGGGGYPHSQHNDYSIIRTNNNTPPNPMSNMANNPVKSKVPMIPKLALHNLNKDGLNSSPGNTGNSESSWPNTAASSNTQPSSQRGSARPVVPFLSLQNIDKFKQDQGGSDPQAWQQSRSSGWFNPVNPTAPPNNNQGTINSARSDSYNPAGLPPNGLGTRLTPRDMASPLNTARTVDSESSERLDGPASLNRHPSQGGLFSNDGNLGGDNVGLSGGIGLIGSEMSGGGSGDSHNAVNRLDSFNISWTSGGSNQLGGNNNSGGGGYNGFNEDSSRMPNPSPNNYGRSGFNPNPLYQGGGGGAGGGGHNYYNQPSSNFSNQNYQSNDPYSNDPNSGGGFNRRGGGGGGSNSSRNYTPRGYQGDYYHGMNSSRSDLGDSNHSIHSQSSHQYYGRGGEGVSGGGGGGHYSHHRYEGGGVGSGGGFTPRQQYQQYNNYNQQPSPYSSYQSNTPPPIGYSGGGGGNNYNQPPNHYSNTSINIQPERGGGGSMHPYQQQPPSAGVGGSHYSNQYNSNNINNSNPQQQPYQPWKQF